MKAETQVATVRQKITQSIKTSADDVFLRSEFNELGGYSQVGRALAAVVAAGELIKCGLGIYVRAKPSSLTGNPIPVLTIMDIGLEVMRKLGVKADYGKAYRELSDGLTTQLPVRAVISVGKSRVRRVIGFGNRKVYFEP